MHCSYLHKARPQAYAGCVARSWQSAGSCIMVIITQLLSAVSSVNSSHFTTCTREGCTGSAVPGSKQQLLMLLLPLARLRLHVARAKHIEQLWDALQHAAKVMHSRQVYVWYVSICIFGSIFCLRNGQSCCCCASPFRGQLTVPPFTQL